MENIYFLIESELKLNRIIYNLFVVLENVQTETYNLHLSQFNTILFFTNSQIPHPHPHPVLCIILTFFKIENV